MNARKAAILVLLLSLVVSVGIVFLLNMGGLTPPIEDTTPPVVLINTPSLGETVGGEVEIDFSATDDGVIQLREIIIDSSRRSTQSSYSWNTASTADGNHTITCRASDESGNTGEASIWVWVNNTIGPIEPNAAPEVVISLPHDGSTVSGNVYISIQVDDEESLVPRIYIDSVSVFIAFLYLWDTTEYTNGVHTIHAEATDSFGLTGTDTIDVTVYNPTPGPSPTYTDAIKIMAYNIEESGANPDWKDVMKEENPDIAILVETGTWDDNDDLILNSVVDEFNSYFVDEFPYVGYCAQSIVYSTSGEAILSRFPILSFDQIHLVTLDDDSSYGVTHDFIHAAVNISGTVTHIIGAHLKASGGSVNEQRREWETEGIINYMDSLGEVPIIYLGDLNSFSPDDTGDLAPLGDLGYGPMTMMLYPDDPIYGQYSSTVHNFTDVFRTLNPTDPGYTYGHQSPSYTSRIDYIIVNSFFDSFLLNSTCGDTPSADTGSDHYSVDMFIHWNLTADETPPSQVTGLNATATGIFQIDLTWDANTELDISHYIVYRNGTPIAAAPSNSYSDTNLNSSTTYSYEVSAVDLSSNEGNKSIPSNATTWVATAADFIVINEFLPDPNVLYTEEWIELYNPTAEDVNLTGYVLDDIVEGGGSPYTIPQGTIIIAGGYLVFNQSTVIFQLNNAGDTVNLIKPDGVTIQDSYSYSSSSNDVSYGRSPDGSETWTTQSTPTPGASNVGAFLYHLEDSIENMVIEVICGIMTTRP